MIAPIKWLIGERPTPETDEDFKRVIAGIFRSLQWQIAISVALGFIYGVFVALGGGWAWLFTLIPVGLIYVTVRLVGSLARLTESHANYREAKGTLDGFNEAVEMQSRQNAGARP